MNAQGKHFLTGGCTDARAWAKDFPTLAAAWDACPNSEWMCWALHKLEYSDERNLRAFACWCVRETPLGDGRKVWDLLTDERSRRAVEVAEAFLRGEATAEERVAAKDAALVAGYLAGPAGFAAWVVAWENASAAAWEAAKQAAIAASWATPDAVDAPRAAAWEAQANALREIVGNPFAVEVTKVAA